MKKVKMIFNCNIPELNIRIEDELFRIEGKIEKKL